MPHDFAEDLDVIGRSSAIPTLLETVSLATGMGFVAVARVTESRWVACRVVDHISFGLLPGEELEIETTLCNEVRQSDHQIVIDDVNEDAVYANHLSPALYSYRAYISVPIYRSDGSFFGTLCAIDTSPKKLNDDRIISMFHLFAKLIGDSLETDEAMNSKLDELMSERSKADVQEQFIAILAHDLRNPINSLTAGLRMMERTKIDDHAQKLVGLMRASVNRMGLLIENLLDQARNRSGRGIVIEAAPTHDLEPALTQIVSELNAVAPDQAIETDFDIADPVNCDVPRVSQLFSNLLGNAITHGKDSEPIAVTAKTNDGMFTLSVANKGQKIPDEMMETLFMPFARGNEMPSREGLGLGLYIASEIAKAHGGALTVASDDQLTVFTFSMANPVG